MNVRKLKAKRVEFGLSQKDLAKVLGISTKTMCIKECDNRNRFTFDEIITITSNNQIIASGFPFLTYKRYNPKDFIKSRLAWSTTEFSIESR